MIIGLGGLPAGGFTSSVSLQSTTPPDTRGRKDAFNTFLHINPYSINKFTALIKGMNLFKVRLFVFVISFCCLPCLLFAQQTFTIHGVLFKKSTSERVSQAIITDLKTNVLMMTDELGGFVIKANKGDTLLFTKKDFTPQKIAVTDPHDLIVYMQPVIELSQVTIKAESEKQELNDVVNTYRSKGLYFDGKPPLMLFSPFGGSPLDGLYEMFSKDAKDERRFIKFSKNEMEASQVDSRYNARLVKRVTALPDSEVVKFMQQYTPSYDDIKQWNDYELISHIKHHLEYYKQHPDGVPEQNLGPAELEKKPY